jgi:hypothetical protein
VLGRAAKGCELTVEGRSKHTWPTLLDATKMSTRLFKKIEGRREAKVAQSESEVLSVKRLKVPPEC